MSAIDRMGDRQRNASPVAHSQRSMFPVGEVGAMRIVPDDLIEQCRNGHDAIVLCVQLAKCSHQELADSLGIDKGHWSRIMQGRANFPDRMRQKLMERCQNYAPLQFDAMCMGFELVSAKDARIRRLEMELAEAKAGRAA